MVIFLLSSLDEIAIGVALILLIHYFMNLGWWVYSIIIVALAVILAIKFYIFYPQFRKPQVGKEGMIGLLGKVIEPLVPEGQVLIEGEIWKAKSIEGKIDREKDIKVVGSDGLKLLVCKAKNE
jgi:membrane-bound serine protease (ClpP class)